jgi:hypothetical protein
MKTKKNVASSNKKCTCSAIQQCEMHRVPRAQQAAANATQASNKSETTGKSCIKKEGKK